MRRRSSKRFQPIVLFRLFALLVAVILLVFLPLASSAQETVHIVQPGENLFRIGLRYGTSWQTLMAYNGLSSTQISVGQRLLVPTAAGIVAPPDSGGLIHIVQAGETLIGIASRHNLTWQDLQTVNGLNSTQVNVGQALAIPGVTAVLPVPAGEASSEVSEHVTHVVQPGETLFAIGLRYKITWHALASANGLSSTRIYVGQSLLVPIASGELLVQSEDETPAPIAAVAGQYVVVSGDTLWTVAQRFGMAAADLAAVNGLTLNSWLYTGQVLTVPGGGEASVQLDILGLSQALPLDCESRSAVDWAAYFGVAIGELDFFWSLPVSDDPDAGFVGDIYGVWGQIPPAPYGVHADPVATALSQRGVPARAVHNLTWEELKSELDAGRPVIVWVIGHVTGGTAAWYTASSGRSTLVAAYEHTVIVTGYGAGDVSLLDGATVYRRSLAQFLDSWAVLGNMAIVAGQ